MKRSRYVSKRQVDLKSSFSGAKQCPSFGMLVLSDDAVSVLWNAAGLSNDEVSVRWNAVGLSDDAVSVLWNAVGLPCSVRPWSARFLSLNVLSVFHPTIDQWLMVAILNWILRAPAPCGPRAVSELRPHTIQKITAQAQYAHPEHIKLSVYLSLPSQKKSLNSSC
jgi:hypothetical protein